MPIFVFLQVSKKWPSQNLENTVFIIILVFGLLPVLLAFIDVIIERGGVIGYGNFKIDFSRIPKWGASEFTVPDNIGLPNHLIDSSRVPDILDALTKSAKCDVAIVDLKDGQAWWEIRLFVLLAGAERLRKPEKIVFVGKKGGIDNSFLGWSHPYELLDRLLKKHPEYLRSYHAARAAAKKWELVEPINLTTQSPESFISEWMRQGLDVKHNVKGFDEKGFPKIIFAEQLLAYDLEKEVKTEEEPKRINIARLNDLFEEVLYKENIDESLKPERKIEKFFESKLDYLAVTQNGKYLHLVSRLMVLNTIIRTMVEKK